MHDLAFVEIQRLSFDQIISHLHPRELLNLARASRATRALLLSKSYASIWRQSLQRLPYVERAPEGYLVEFADMMFGERCYVRVAMYRRR